MKVFFEAFLGHEMDAFKMIEAASRGVFSQGVRWEALGQRLGDVLFLYEDVCARVSVSQTDAQTDRWFD